MDSELQWFSDSEIWSLFERGSTSNMYVSVLLLVWFLILRLGLRFREVIVLMLFYMMQ